VVRGRFGDCGILALGHDDSKGKAFGAYWCGISNMRAQMI
jgi:hypothetical protein